VVLKKVLLHTRSSEIWKLVHVHCFVYTDEYIWYKSITGSCITRNQEQIQYHNRVQDAYANQNVTLNVGPNDLHKLQAQAPVPITDMVELIYTLQRIDALASMFFPQCVVATAARTALQFLLNNGTHSRLATDTEWMRIKPNELIWLLRNFEHAEFSHVLSEQEFAGPELPNFYMDHSLPQQLQQWFAPSAMFSNTVLPKELCPRLAIQLPPVVGAAVNQQHATTQRHDRGSSTSASAPANRPRPNTQGSTTNATLANAPARNNEQFPQALRTFWALVPAAHQSDSMSRWLQTVQTSTNGCLQLLGLTPEACGLYHLKGTCSRRNCTLQHNAHTYPQAAVDKVVGHLRNGLANAN
jgi:hypothetical protein